MRVAADVLASMSLPCQAVLNPLQTVRFVAPAGHSFDYTTATIEAVVIDRLAFDSAWAARAESAGATVVRGRRVIGVEPASDGVDVFFADDPSPLRARAAILACGANYAIQKRLGLGMPSAFLQSAQLEVPAARIGRDVALGVDDHDVRVHPDDEVVPLEVLEDERQLRPRRRPAADLGQLGPAIEVVAVAHRVPLERRPGDVPQGAVGPGRDRADHPRRTRRPCHGADQRRRTRAYSSGSCGLWSTLARSGASVE